MGRIGADIRQMIEGMEFNGRVIYDEPMSRHTSLGIGGPAAAIAAPSDRTSLILVVSEASRLSLPIMAVGSGTNLLIRDGGVERLLVSMDAFSVIESVDAKGDSTTVKCGSGAKLQRLVSFASGNGLSGMEGLAGIPGTVGGAIAGNSGSYGVEIKDVLERLTLIDVKGHIRTMERKALAFGYRRAELPQFSTIIDAEFVFRRDDPQAVKQRVAGHLKEKKATQPIGDRSAGCVFKNPANGSAGRLIDEAGLKGKRIGGVEVSTVHANFFINRGGGTAEDFLRLMDMVSERVNEIFGVVLEPEIRILDA